MKRACLLAALAPVATLVVTLPFSATSRGGWQLRPVGLLNCNGFSPVQEPIKRTQSCVEIASNSMAGGDFDDTACRPGPVMPCLPCTKFETNTDGYAYCLTGRTPRKDFPRPTS